MDLMRTFKTILQGKILSHPLHPVIVHFPIGCWTLSFIFDVISFIVDDPTLSLTLWRSSIWAIGIGLIASVAAAITGFAEFSDVPKQTAARGYGFAHLIANGILMFGYLCLFFTRNRDSPSLPQVAVNGLLFLVLGLSGYLGGKLVYRYRVGVRSIENPQRAVSPEDHLVW